MEEEAISDQMEGVLRCTQQLVLRSDPKYLSERFPCLQRVRLQFLLVAAVATGDANDEEMAKPGCNEPEQEQEVEEVIFPSY
jgi:hypothetical protein